MFFLQNTRATITKAAAGLFATAGFLVVAPQAAHADFLTTVGLFNTGVDANRAKLADTATDPHYTVTTTTTPANGGPIGPGTKIVRNDSLFPLNSYWVRDNSSAASAWIIPAGTTRDNAPNQSGPNLVYKFTTKFNFTGTNLDWTRATLGGRFSTDNFGYVQLNGNTATSGGNITTAQGYRTWTDFSFASSAFVAGENVLDFYVTNITQQSGNPTGLRVEFYGEAPGTGKPPSGAPTIPEFGTMASLGGLLFAMGLTVVKRRRTA